MYSCIACKKVRKFPLSGPSFFTKLKMATKGHVEYLIPQLFDVYFNVIPRFHMIFNAEFISKALCIFRVLVKDLIQDGRH